MQKIPFEDCFKVILVYCPKDDWHLKIYKENRLEIARKYADTKKELIAKQKKAEEKKEESKNVDS